MTYLYEVLDVEELQYELSQGYVREQTHPDYPELHILNYTEKAQFERRWNDVTRVTRGLIYDHTNGKVLARPFPKIHNFDEPEAPRIVDDQILYSWSNKYDGSLGILYHTPLGVPAIATRGSFASDQAIKATEMLHASGMAWEYGSWIDEGYTPLFEIIYPENRIVLNYGEQEKLVPLGKIHIATGAYLPGFHGEQRTMHDLLMDLSRENSEGWVAWLTPYKAVKIKQADYVELHRIVTGLNKKSVWREVQKGPSALLEWATQMPDELYKWVYEVADELSQAYAERMREIDNLYIEVLESDVWTDDEKIDRPQFAAEAKRIAGKDASYMFSMLDGKDIQSKVWGELEPRGDER